MTPVYWGTSTPDAASWLAARVAKRLQSNLQTRHTAWLVVSGGQSPRPVYAALASADIGWSEIWVSLADERLVPRDHPDRNELMVRQSLLQGPASMARWRPLADDAGDPQKSLQLAGEVLAAAADGPSAMILGMGSDGHVLSWFPESPETPGLLSTTGPLAGLSTPGTAPWQRITLGWPMVERCLQVFLWLGTQEKTRSFRDFDARQDRSLPVLQLVDRLGERLTLVGVEPDP